uniref:Splicing factor Cactin n=1 Tax=Solanum lycopersicum TaxID=4081 RepID=A0A3Q7IML6_SOLLC
MGSSGNRRSKGKTASKSGRRRRRSSDDIASDSDSISHTESESESDSSPPSSSRRRSSSSRSKSRAQKKAAKVAKKLKTQNVSGYSNDSNPFGDSNLNENFVWRKKIERDVTRGVPLDTFSMKAEKQRQKERMAEIEKVKKRREERAIEKAQREEELQMLARERARAEFQDWEKKEEEFHFDQSKVRTEIRLRQGRVKPIDVLIKQLEPSGDFDVEIDEPYVVFKGLAIKEMEELQEDIKLHIDLDRETPLHIQYWEALLVVCDWELAEARRREAMDKARVRGEELPHELLAEERGLHSSIETDVKSLLQGKGYGELEALQSQIESQMRSGTAKVVEYWEAVLKRLQIYKAKACLREIHAKMLREHLEHLEKPVESRDVEVEETLRTDEEDTDHEQNDVRAISPEPILNEDRAILERKRMAVLEERRAQDKILPPTPAEDNFEKKASKTMGAMEEGDVVFGSNDEINLDSQVYWWHDKYRPRKPKYFNRVHTGYEWNKYNQTHYDHDNPPPKIVQGYKFNIFYPDLVDKARAPTYVIEKDGDSADTCIIKFHAGPPYEDIAFRIVNREWEYSHKKGFKCIFDRGILHLYFNFKRHRYRR